MITRSIGSKRKMLNSACRMYRGMVPPLLGVTPIFAVSFWVC